MQHPLPTRAPSNPAQLGGLLRGAHQLLPTCLLQDFSCPKRPPRRQLNLLPVLSHPAF